MSTKVDLNHSKVLRVEDLDELAQILFPGNRDHQRVFVAVFVELKWADGQFLSALEPIADKHGLSCRVLETVRAKMRRLGLIDHVSRFNRQYGYREGWVFSKRFERSLDHVELLLPRLRERKSQTHRQKDENAILYI